MLKPKATRFYETVEVNREDDVYSVTLDGRPIRTPQTTAINLPTEALANEIAKEWSDQGDEIKPLTMPVMRLACTAVDKVAPVRSQIIEQLVRYGESDMLCYRADHPDDLVKLQAEIWQPLLDWISDTKGVSLNVTSGIVHVSQPSEALATYAVLIDQYDDFKLAALGELTQLTGSLVLGLACVEGRLNQAETFEAAQLDEDWQAEKWGKDYEAIDRRQNLENDIIAAVRYLKTLG